MRMAEGSPGAAAVDRLVRKLAPLVRAEEWGRRHAHWIAVAGGPGSGKTTIAEGVAARLNTLRGGSAVVIPMDGWHIPQADLVAKYGEEALLKRGAPWTFNLDLMAVELTRAKSEGRASLPSYSREISDPIPGAVVLQPQHRVVLVEGLYLLPPCCPDDMLELWDERWFVLAPSREVQVERIVRRSLATWTDRKAAAWGPGHEGARRRAETNDMPNMELVEAGHELAQEIIVNG